MKESGYYFAVYKEKTVVVEYREDGYLYMTGTDEIFCEHEFDDIDFESCIHVAIKYIKGSYCDAHLNTPYMLMGDVAELIKILTGKEVDWQELAKHSR